MRDAKAHRGSAPRAYIPAGRTWAAVAALLSSVLLSGCPASSQAPGAASGAARGGRGGTASAITRGSGEQAATCSKPKPVTTMNGSVTDNVPTDFDPTANPKPRTTVYFTVMLPKRCPGQTFPLVLQGPGWGNTRITTPAANGDLQPGQPMFTAVTDLVRALPYHGYAVISFDERGQGESTDANARVIDPRAETQDARAILDWAYGHASSLQLRTQPGSGIPKDLDVGTIGLSYGGGFQLPLAALDPRIDAMIPVAAWNDLLYSLMPGNAVKLSWGGLLCAVGDGQYLSGTGVGSPVGSMTTTPLVRTLCNIMGPQDPAADTIRTKQDLVTASSSSLARPRPVTQQQATQFFFRHGMAYFQQQQGQGLAWGGSSDPYPGASPPLRPVPALFFQGNRDVLFNMTEAYWNAQYFGAAGGDVRVITTEGGHMNPLANQTQGTANCGGTVGVQAMLAWFNHYLKGETSKTFDAIPKRCISVVPTRGAASASPVGVDLDSIPVGSLSGTGAIPVSESALTATVSATDVNPVFVPVTTIKQSGAVLAGIPKLGEIKVAAAAGAVVTPIAYVGVGIERTGSTYLVDDQVTTFVQGDYTRNPNVPQSRAVLLPGVGEQLHKGDVVGLLFYQHQVQYQAVASTGTLTGVTGLSTSATGLANPYTVTASDVELPVFVPGRYPGSRLTK